MMIFSSLICVIFVLFVPIIRGQSSCLSPNQRIGYCTSVYDCPALLQVLVKGQQTPLTTEVRRFLYESQCPNGVGRKPHVCCNEDTGYISSPPPATQRLIETPATVTRPTVSRPTSGNGRGNVLPTIPHCGQLGSSNKVYNGNDTALDEFPWMALLYYRKRDGKLEYQCAGSLINQRYVLTAAHCGAGEIFRESIGLETVRLGDYNTNTDVDCDSDGDCADPHKDFGVEEIIVHESFFDNEPNRHNDIALVRLNQDVTYSDFIKPVCLPSANSFSRSADGSNLVVAGWGRTLVEKQSAIKQKLFVPVNNQDECAAKFGRRKINIAPTQLCAGGKFAEDSCDRDSGGPLMKLVNVNYALEGIVSFGYKCGLEGWPGVYTRVSEFENWIKNNLKP